MKLNEAITYARSFSASPAVLNVKRFSKGKLSVKRFSETGEEELVILADEPTEDEFELETEATDDVVVAESAGNESTDEIFIGVNGGEVDESDLSDNGYVEENCGTTDPTEPVIE